MTAMTIQCQAGHPRKTVAIVAELGQWDVNPVSADMARYRHPVHGYVFRCTCGAHVAVDKDDMHLIAEQAWEREQVDTITLHALIRARQWQGGIRKPSPIYEHERTT